MNDMVSLIFFLCRTIRLSSLNPDQAYGHLHIFTASNAPGALVMLYMSSYKLNRYGVDDAIRHLFCASKIVLNKDSYNRCGLIALEFCKWLCRAAGTCDPLYVFYRNSLVSMLELTDSLEKKELIGFKDIFPFVKELAVKLSHDWMLSTESTPLLSDVKDFSVFMVLVRKKIKRYVLNCGPIIFYFGDRFLVYQCVIWRRLSICMRFLLACCVNWTHV
ncbi:hypothetical protein ACJIZ3_006147 [Penstemon smallii]|uniref:Uncharacterized protein n=1 Tax=Penstemon smallii TaxID=265156 RepID=A0ABD3S707_9LAMI